MDLFRLFFGFLVAFLILLLVLIFAIPPAAVGGTEHLVYETMQQSSPADLTGTRWVFLLFGFGIIGFFTFALFIGAQKADNKINREMKNPLWIGIGFYVLVFIAMVVTYWSYVPDGQEHFWGGFPIPSAWMLYGVALVPAYFTVIYVLRFDRWIISASEIEKFKKLIEENQRNIEKKLLNEIDPNDVI